MPLDAEDILKKTFKTRLKGYDEDEVDMFLDEVIEEFKNMKKQAKELENENKILKELLTDIRAKM